MGEQANALSMLGQRPYRRLWSARTVSQWGDAFNTVALALLVYSLTGTGTGTGIGVSGVVVAEIIPVLLLAPVAGAVVDRLRHRSVMIAADLIRAGLAFALPFVAGNVAAVYAVAFGLSAAAVFFNPAAQSLLPTLVRERELVAANSALWTAAVVSQVALAPLAGVVVAACGYSWAFWINAASYLASAAFLLRLAPSPSTAKTPEALAPEATADRSGAGRSSWPQDVREGLSAVAGHELLRPLATAQFIAALSAGATGALLVVLAREHLQLDEAGYGWLLAAIGVGAALGPCCHRS